MVGKKSPKFANLGPKFCKSKKSTILAEILHLRIVLLACTSKSYIAGLLNPVKGSRQVEIVVYSTDAEEQKYILFTDGKTLTYPFGINEIEINLNKLHQILSSQRHYKVIDQFLE